MDIEHFLWMVLLYGLPAILAITLHEAAHGYVALYFGDPTAKEAGRLSLNPLRHLDPIGTVVLPGILIFIGAPFLFGYAKPVPVTFHRLRHPKRNMVWVAAAGPVINVALAILSALFIRWTHTYFTTEGLLLGRFDTLFVQSMIFSIHINVTLALFNMVPIPPLDGGRVLVGLLPHPYDLKVASFERYGFILVFALFFLIPQILGRTHEIFWVFNHGLLESIRWVKDVLILPIMGPEFQVL